VATLQPFDYYFVFDMQQQLACTQRRQENMMTTILHLQNRLQMRILESILC
jgi:hypothetical protein